MTMTSSRRWTGRLLATGVLVAAIGMTAAGPAEAKWKRGHPHGYYNPHGYYYAPPPPVYYAPPPVYYAPPPPVYYAPPPVYYHRPYIYHRPSLDLIFRL